jgi:hypothetical protein
MFFKKLHILQSTIFDFVIYFSWFLYILITFGISIKAPEYLNFLEYYIKLYVSLFLIYRFNPFRKIKFTELDSKIAYNAGIFLFTTTTINQLLILYINNLKNYALTFVE